MCVRISSVRRVLQFTPHNAVSCVLHRSAIRVIHRLQSYRLFIELTSATISVFRFHSSCDSANAYTSLAPATRKSKEPQNGNREVSRLDQAPHEDTDKWD